MSRKHNIRWRRSDYSKLTHLVKKVNKKIFSIEVKHPEISEYQPEMLDYQTLKSQIETRADFNNLMKKYKRYLKEGAEDIQRNSRGAVATNWEIKEFNIAQRAENTRRRHRKQELESKEVTIGGKGTGSKRSEMGSIKENEVKPSRKSFDKMASQTAWKKAVALFDRKMRHSYYAGKQKIMLENYIRGLIREGYSEEVQKLMNHIPLDVFEEQVDLDEFATFDFIYDPINLKIREDRIKEFWEQYADEKIDNGIDYEKLIEGIDN